MNSSRKILGQIGIRVLLTTALAAAVTFFGSRAWESINIIIAFDSVLAFLAITSAAHVYGTFRSDPSAQHIVIFAALVTQAALLIGSGVDYLLGFTAPVVQKTMDRITSDIIEVTILAITILVATFLRTIKFSPKVNRILIVLIVVGSLSSYGLFYALVLTTVSAELLIIIGFVAVMITIISFLISAIHVVKHQDEPQKYDLTLYLLSMVIFCIATIPLFLNLVFPSLIWTLSLTLLVGGFFSFTMSAAVPWQIDLGISRWRADASSATLCLLALTPFIVFVIAESWAPGISIMYLGAYYISHAEAALLSGLIAGLVYAYSRRNPSPEYLPLILLFISWSYMELHLILFSPLERLIAGREPYLPYIIGSMFSIMLLFWAAHNIVKPPMQQLVKNQGTKIILWICIVIASVWTGEFIRNWVLQGIPGIGEIPLAASIILVSNLLAMFAFIYLANLLTTKGGGWESAEVVTAGFLSFWIVRNILKAVFEDWSIGWWAAELLLLAGLVLGPVILGMLYLASMFEAKASQHKATLYADLLGHDITNYLQAIQVALDILDLEGAPADVKLKAMSDARLSLTRADHLIRNVKHLGRTQESQAKSIERTDLVICIYRALSQVILMSSPDEVEFNINKDRGECYVPANDLLTDIFLNLFRNAIKYSTEKKRIDVEIKFIQREDGSEWEVQVIDYGIGIEPERKELLFSRFMERANGTGLGLWVVKALTDSFAGEVEVKDRVQSDYTKGSVFVVRFPAFKE